MVSIMPARDPLADSFENAEKALNEWGDACRRNSEALVMPTLRSIAQMIDHVRRQERLQKGVKKKKLKKKICEQRKKEEPTDAKEVAEVLGYIDFELTAKGKQKNSFKPVNLELSSIVAKVDHIVSTLPGWMRTTIQRSYLYRQPDRKAAQDLRIPKDTYRLRRISAVEYIAERLGD